MVAVYVLYIYMEMVMKTSVLKYLTKNLFGLLICSVHYGFLKELLSFLCVRAVGYELILETHSKNNYPVLLH